MKEFFLERTEYTPEIKLNPFTGVFEISGESRPEDARKFYAEVIDWLKNYFSVFYSDKNLARKQQGMTFIFKMDYFNSTSAKFLHDIVGVLNQNFEKGADIKIHWCYKSGDEDMKEAGEDFSEFAQLSFDVLEITDDLIITSTKNTPSIQFYPKAGTYTIEGRSYPEEGAFFYQPVLEWIDMHGAKYFNDSACFEFKIEYFNTSSSKAFMDIFKKLNKFYLEGSFQKIAWYYEEEDDDLMATLDDYKSVLKVPLETIYKG